MLIGGIVLMIAAIALYIAAQYFFEDTGCILPIGLVVLFVVGIALVYGGISGPQAAADYLHSVFG